MTEMHQGGANFGDNPRPSSELPCRAAPRTNRDLGYVSQGVGQAVTSSIDVADDSIDYGGIVANRQARDYTNIGFNAVRRTDDIAFRETNRYADYTMDTIDDGAGFGARAIRRWPGVATGVVQRAFGSTKRVYQSALHTYGESVDRTYFSFWDIFTPPEPRAYMVGSMNGTPYCDNGYALPGSGYRCRPPQLPVEPVEQTSEKNPKNPVTAYK